MPPLSPQEEPDNVELDAIVANGIEANDRLEALQDVGEAALVQQDRTLEAVRDLEAPLEAIVLNTEPKEVQNIRILPFQDPDDGPISELPDTDTATALLSLWRANRGPKGEKGDQGEQGIQGIQGEQGIPGRDGMDGYNGIDGIDGKDGLPGKDGKDGERGEIGPAGPRGPKGLKGDKGDQGSPDTGAQIVEKIDGLLPFSALKDGEQVFRSVASRDYDLAELKDVSIGNQTNNQALAWDEASQKWVPKTLGGGGGGAVDSVNGQTGVVVLDAGDVGADVVGAAAAAESAANAYTDAEIAAIHFPVDSVNGQTGTVVLSAADVGAATAAQGATADSAVQPGDLALVATTGDYDDLSNKPTIPTQYTDADARASVSLTTTGSSGPATYDNGTGVLNIPEYAGGGGGGVDSVVGGTGIDVDDTDPANPIANLDAATIASLGLADTATQPGDLAPVATSGDYDDLTDKPTLGTMAAEAASDYYTAAEVDTELGDYIPLAQKGAASGVATLDGGSKIPTSQLPGLALTDVFTVGSQAAQLALTVEEGDIVIRTDQNKTYAQNGGTSGTMADWSELLSPTDQVTSVNGQQGVVTLATGDIAESTDANYVSDAESALLGGITASAAELNTLDGITASTAELNYTDGVTSAIQTQLDSKGTFTLPALTTGSVLFSDGTTVAQDNANLFYDDTNNRLGIGTATPPGKLSTVGATPTTSYSANAITYYPHQVSEVTTAPASNLGHSNTVFNSIVSPSVANTGLLNGIINALTNVGATHVPASITAIRTMVKNSIAGGAMSSLRGLQNSVENAAATSVTNVYANDNSVTLGAGATSTNVYAVMGSIFLSAASAAATTAMALYAKLSVSNASATIGTAYGLRIDDLTNSGTITDTYGIHIGDMTAGTQTNQAYGIYQSDTNARNYFGGSTVFNTSVTGGSFVPVSSTIPTKGMYAPGIGSIGFAIGSTGEVQLDSTALSPVTNDGNALGTTTNQWSDLFLAEGGVINWDNGDATLTQTGNSVALSGANLALTDTNANLSLGSSSSSSTATPTTLNMGGTFADSITSAKAKWKLYDDGTAINTYGIGITSGQMNFFKLTGGSYKWYFSDVEKMGLDSNGNLTLVGAATVADEAYGSGWNGSTQVPTKNAVYDKIETIANPWTMVKKTSDESRSSTTTRTADSALQFSMLANTNYVIRGLIMFASASATPDIAYQLSGPALGNDMAGSIYSAGLNPTSQTTLVFNNYGATAQNALSTATGVGYIQLQVAIRNQTAGTFSFNWAQNTSDATPTTVLKGSYLEYMAA